MGSPVGRQLFHVKRSVREPGAGSPEARRSGDRGPGTASRRSGRLQPEPYRTPPRRRAGSDAFFVCTCSHEAY